MKLRAYIVDDEQLAIDRLVRLLAKAARIEIVGSTTSPQTALEFLRDNAPDVLFLDIQMPGMTGFDLLSKLTAQPIVIFTTAHDEYALQAFEVNSIDYLLKPIDPQQLDRALNKIERLRANAPVVDYRKLLEDVTASMRRPPMAHPDRIASRAGDRIRFLE